MRLNKLLYFAQGHALEQLGSPLFDADFEAWEFGPVAPDIYHKYKYCGNNPISAVDDEFDPNGLPPELANLLAEVSVKYEQYSTSALIGISHQPGSPWSETPRGGVISVEAIKKWFNRPEIKLVPLGERMRKLGVAPLEVLPSGWHDPDDDDYWAGEVNALERASAQN
jgi:uncharacterized phage-associated protein